MYYIIDNNADLYLPPPLNGTITICKLQYKRQLRPHPTPLLPVSYFQRKKKYNNGRGWRGGFSLWQVKRVEMSPWRGGHLADRGRNYAPRKREDNEGYRSRRM